MSDSTAKTASFLKRPPFSFALFFGLFIFLLVIKSNILRTPYYWDVMGYVVPSAQAFYMTFSFLFFRNLISVSVYARLAQHLRKLSSRKGFLLLACSHRPGRGLTPEAKRAFRTLGLDKFPKNQQKWYHVALVDLGSKRVIAERSGADPQRLFLGGYRLDAGFRIHALCLVRDPD